MRRASSSPAEGAHRGQKFLAGVGVFDDSPKIAQLSRSAEVYEFRLAVKVDPQSPQMIEGAHRMSADLSGVLHGRPVAVTFCEGWLSRTLHPVQPQTAEGGTRPSHVPGGPYRTEVILVPANRPPATALPTRDLPANETGMWLAREREAGRSTNPGFPRFQRPCRGARGRQR